MKKDHADETDKVTNTADPFSVVGPDSVTRSLSEHYYLPKDVDPDPFGAWMAIQNQSARIEELEAKLAKAVDALAPFSLAARHHAADAPEWGPFDSVSVQLSIGYLRDACATLADLKGTTQ